MLSILLQLGALVQAQIDDERDRKEAGTPVPSPDPIVIVFQNPPNINIWKIWKELAPQYIQKRIFMYNQLPGKTWKDTTSFVLKRHPTLRALHFLQGHEIPVVTARYLFFQEISRISPVKKASPLVLTPDEWKMMHDSGERKQELGGDADGIDRFVAVGGFREQEPQFTLSRKHAQILVAKQKDSHLIEKLGRVLRARGIDPSTWEPLTISKTWKAFDGIEIPSELSTTENYFSLGKMVNWKDVISLQKLDTLYNQRMRLFDYTAAGSQRLVSSRGYFLGKDGDMRNIPRLRLYDPNRSLATEQVPSLPHPDDPEAEQGKYLMEMNLVEAALVARSSGYWFLGHVHLDIQNPDITLPLSEVLWQDMDLQTLAMCCFEDERV